MNDVLTRRLALTAGMATVLLLACWAYLPGLTGGFLFDDFVNLDALGSSGPIDSWPTFWRYLTSGTADPTGRPLALLSFLVDSRDWPADPGPFLRTNLIIHLLNGVLLFSLLRALGRVAGNASQARNTAAALLASALWLLHPLFVSTTLYAVQREAMLPATFVLLGLLAYGHGRVLFASTGGASGSAWMYLGIGAGSVLATLCKANGVLLPLLAWALEATVFSRLEISASHPEPARRLARTRLVLLVAPSVMILAYLAHYLGDWNAFPPNRPWTIGQRILTEPRILLDYVQLLLVPRSVSSGLFNDQYQASTGLLQPWTTLPSLALVLLSLGWALRSRAMSPVLASSILFFLAGHALESSTVPLELYFEHRNYLPAMLFFWPAARAVCAWRRPRWARATVALLLVAMLGLTTHQRSQLWGDPGRLAASWAAANPASSRAQAMVAMSLVDQGRAAEAAAVLGPRWRERPHDLQIAASYFVAKCSAGPGLSAEEKRAMSRAIRASVSDQELLVRWLAQAADVAAQGTCGDLDLDDVETWARASGRNATTQALARRMQDSILGRIALHRGNPGLALTHFNRQLRLTPKPELAAVQSALLASRGYFSHALAHLDEYERHEDRMSRPGPGMPFLHAKVLEWQGYWPAEMNWLRSSFEQARRTQGNPP